MRLIRDYFGDAKAQPKVPPYAPPPPPEQTHPRVLDLEDKNAKTRGVFYGWHVPKNREPEHYALELAAVLLGDGESSRLHQRLVRQDATARSVDAWTNDHRGPDLLALRILLTERANIGDVERVIDQELQRLSTREPSPAELEKAKNRVSAYHVFGLESNLQRAIRMGSFELFYGDARLLERELDRYLAVSSAQVQAAVKKYLTPSRRSPVRVHPPAGQPAQRAATAQPAAQPAKAAPAKPAAPKAKPQNKAMTP
jgi:predicted Zn-dependent peptidase